MDHHLQFFFISKHMQFNFPLFWNFGLQILLFLSVRTNQFKQLIPILDFNKVINNFEWVDPFTINCNFLGLGSRFCCLQFGYSHLAFPSQFLHFALLTFDCKFLFLFDISVIVPLLWSFFLLFFSLFLLSSLFSCAVAKGLLLSFLR